MNIMILSDQESKLLYEYYDPERIKDIDLLISCGDLPPEYLTFFASVCHAPLVYVRGNHDNKYAYKPPEGCICIEDKIYTYKGLRIMGLGGSIRYKKGINQYTQRQMQHRVSRMWLQLKCKKGFDILLTHSPAAGINDGFDSVHQGFTVFNELLDTYHPAYFIHGHIHKNYQANFVREQQYNETTIINGYERYIIDV